MITEDYVSFETAKLLKEKGFNWGVHANYPVMGPDIGKRMYLANSALRDTPRGTDFNECGAWISCPTLQVARKWVEEVNRLVIIVDYSKLLFGSKPYYVHIYSLEGPQGRGCDLSPSDPYYEYNYEKYEQALEAGIKYALENLI